MMTAIFVCLLSGTPQAVASDKSASIVTIEGESYYVHNVEKGETIYSLSKQYAVDEKEITRNNPQAIEGLQVGQVLKIPVVKKDEKLSKRKERRIFDTHIVNQGETLYSISRRYEIPVNTLLEDNEGLDPAQISIGQEIKIRKKSMGDASPDEIAEQMEDYRDAINRVATDVTYHLVASGETIYGLSKKYNVTEQQIKDSNDLKDGLKAGAVVVIPVPSEMSEDGTLILTDGDSKKQDERDAALWPWDKDQEVGEYSGFKDVSSKNVINVALLLPLSGEGGKGNDNFLDFYQGVLLGLEELKADRTSVNVSLYNTSRSKNEVVSIVDTPEFKESDLIIGPVYEDALAPVLRYAESKGVPVVSPLAVVENTNSPVLFQMAPDQGNKYAKLNSMLANEKNVIYISTAYPDKELESEVKPYLPKGYKEVTFSQSAMSSIGNLIDKKGNNIIIVSCIHEYTVDRILATISSMHNNLVARSMSNADIRVVGSSRWARFHTNIDKNLYFKLKLTYVTSYHADRGNFQIKNFDQRFISEFSALPTPYAYRGYDIIKLFVGASKEPGTDYVRKLNSNKRTLLQMDYNFVDRVMVDAAPTQPSADNVWNDDFSQDRDHLNRDVQTKPVQQSSRPALTWSNVARHGTNGYVNNQWALVSYNSNYSIEVR